MSNDHDTTIPSTLMPMNLGIKPKEAPSSHPILKVLIAIVGVLLVFMLFKR